MQPNKLPSINLISLTQNTLANGPSLQAATYSSRRGQRIIIIIIRRDSSQDAGIMRAPPNKRAGASGQGQQLAMGFLGRAIRIALGDATTILPCLAARVLSRRLIQGLRFEICNRSCCCCWTAIKLLEAKILPSATWSGAEATRPSGGPKLRRPAHARESTWAGREPAGDWAPSGAKDVCVYLCGAR